MQAIQLQPLALISTTRVSANTIREQGSRCLRDRHFWLNARNSSGMSRCARPQAGHCARMQLLQGISELLPVVLQLLQLLLGSRRGHAILLLLLLLRRLCCYGWGQQRGSGGGGSAGCGSVGGRGLRGDGREGCELRGCGGSRCDGSGCLWELAHVDGGKVGHQERIVHLAACAERAGL